MCVYRIAEFVWAEHIIMFVQEVCECRTMVGGWLWCLSICDSKCVGSMGCFIQASSIPLQSLPRGLDPIVARLMVVIPHSRLVTMNSRDIASNHYNYCQSSQAQRGSRSIFRPFRAVFSSIFQQYFMYFPVFSSNFKPLLCWEALVRSNSHLAREILTARKQSKEMQKQVTRRSHGDPRDQPRISRVWPGGLVQGGKDRPFSTMIQYGGFL